MVLGVTHMNNNVVNLVSTLVQIKMEKKLQELTLV